jgi:hypothetical protein
MKNHLNCPFLTVPSSHGPCGFHFRKRRQQQQLLRPRLDSHKKKCFLPTCIYARRERGKVMRFFCVQLALIHSGRREQVPAHSVACAAHLAFDSRSASLEVRILAGRTMTIYHHADSLTHSLSRHCEHFDIKHSIICLRVLSPRGVCMYRRE